jgi:hypothetical protein
MFKKPTSAAAVAVALTLFAGGAQAANIAVNGGFETGDFTGWTVFPNAGTQSVGTTNPSSGTYAARLTQTTPNANIIKQANLAPGQWTSGQSITVNFDIRGTAAAGAVFFAEVFSEIDGGGVSKSEILGGAPLFPNPDANIWTSYSFTTTVGPDTSGGVTVQLASICGAVEGCNADYFIDNVEVLAEIAAVPVPAAVWLFGSALGLLGWARRRQAV